MIDNVSRRKLLSATAVAVGGVSGCGSEGTTHASLSMDLYNVSNENGSYVIDMRPRVGVEGDWEPFRNVSVIVQNEQENVICWHPIGNRSDNLILYREHLRSGNGVYGSNERVDQQVGIHNVSQAPSAMGADVDSDPAIEHSNIHIGELHWAQNDPSQSGNPVTDATTPNPSLTVEVDYDESVADLDIINRVEQASDTYYLYGMAVNYRFDEEVETLSALGYNLDPTRLSSLDAALNEDENHDNQEFAYMFITRNGGGGGGGIIGIEELDWTGDPQGVASCQGDDLQCEIPLGTPVDLLSFGTVVFTQDIYDSQADPDALATKTMVHETSHLLGAGRADDGSIAGVLPTEVYSGTQQDDSPEELRDDDRIWSVMASGATPDMIGTYNREYVPLSIEEVSALLNSDFIG